MAILSPAPQRVQLSKSQIASVLSAMTSQQQSGRKVGPVDRIAQVRRLAEAGAIRTLEPLLPLCLNLDQKPYSLEDYFPFSPVFNTEMPKSLLLVTGRQCSKSTSMAARSIMLSACLSNFRSFFITPRYEQIRRFSNNFIRPFINNSPIRALWTGTNTENSVLQRSFRNSSTMLFSFAFLDADRIRGIPSDCVTIDEVQDFDKSFISIVRECMSASRYGIMQFTGTPKTLSHGIHSLWATSSQAEWFVPCLAGGCNTWNIPSRDNHIDAMLGKAHDFISEKSPGTVCRKCRKPISPRHGHWVHRNRDKKTKFPGYHIPQIILPLHYARPDKWQELMAKREGWGNTPLHVFYNEVLGESVDSGQKLISETQLKAAAILPWENRPNEPAREMMSRLKHYKMRALGVDWGGGGEEGVSFTALSLLGYAPDGKIHCLWGKRLVISQEHLLEAEQILHWVKVFGVDLVAHDYTGAGVVRETVMVQAGLDLDRVMAIQYVRSATKSLLKYVPPTVLHNRAHFRLDKTRSLLYVMQAIKLKMLQFFRYDDKGEGNSGVIKDFLSLVEEKTESRQAGDIYTILSTDGVPDDFAQATNIGVCALWHANNSWPDFAQAAGIARVTPRQVQAYGNRDYGWNEDAEMRGFFNQP